MEATNKEIANLIDVMAMLNNLSSKVTTNAINTLGYMLIMIFCCLVALGSLVLILIPDYGFNKFFYIPFVYFILGAIIVFIYSTINQKKFTIAFKKSMEESDKKLNKLEEEWNKRNQTSGK